MIRLFSRKDVQENAAAALLREIAEEVEAAWQFHALNGTLECVPHLQRGLAAVAQAERQIGAGGGGRRLQDDLKSRSPEQRRLALLALPALGERMMLSEPIHTLLIERLADHSPEVNEVARRIYAPLAPVDPHPEKAPSALYGALERMDPGWRFALEALLGISQNPNMSRKNIELRLQKLAHSNSRIR